MCLCVHMQKRDCINIMHGLIVWRPICGDALVPLFFPQTKYKHLHLGACQVHSADKMRLLTFKDSTAFSKSEIKIHVVAVQIL